MSPPMPIIRPERPADAEAISALLEACFDGPLEARLVENLRAHRNLSVSLVAECDGRIVGHVAFSPVRAGSEIGTGLAPLAVATDHRRLGLGARLVREGLDAARNRQERYAVVLGNPAYYGRFGFIPAERFDLTDRFGGGAAFQILELHPGGLPMSAGIVEYADEFSIFAPPPAS